MKNSKKIFLNLFSKKYWYNGLLQSFRLQFLLALLLILLIATLAGISMTFLSSSNALSQKFYNRFLWGFFQTIDSGSIPETIGIMNSGANDSLWHNNAIIIITIACLAWMLGSIIFNLITSAFTNFLDLRKKDLEQGLVRYKFKKHAIIIGWDFQGIAIINQIRRDMGSNAEIVIMTHQEANNIRQELRKKLPADALHDIYIYHGVIECDESLEEKEDRNLSELEMLYPQFARVIYILGEPDKEQRSAANRKLVERITHIVQNTFEKTFFVSDCEVDAIARNLVSLCSHCTLFEKIFSVCFDYAGTEEKNYFYQLALESAQEGNLKGHNLRYYELLLMLKMNELKKPSHLISKLYVCCFSKISDFAKRISGYPSEPAFCYVYLADELAFKLGEKYDRYNSLDTLIIYPFNFYRDKAFHAIADGLHSMKPLAFRENSNANHVHIIITNFNEMAKAIVLQAAKSICCQARSKITIFSIEPNIIHQFLMTNRLYNLNCVDFEIIESPFESTTAIKKLDDALCDITASVSLVITDNDPLAVLRTYCSLPDFCKYKKFRILIESHMEQDFEDMTLAKNSKLPPYEIIGQITAPSYENYWNALENCHYFEKNNKRIRKPVFSEQSIRLYADDIFALLRDCMPEICAMQRASFSSVSHGIPVKQEAWGEILPSMKHILEQKIPDSFALNKINNDYSKSDFPSVDNLLKFLQEFPEICLKMNQVMPDGDPSVLHVSYEKRARICGYIFSENHPDDDTYDCFDICSHIDKIDKQDGDTKRAKAKLLFCPNAYTIQNLFIFYFNIRNFYLILPCSREEYEKQLPHEIQEDYRNCCLNADDIFIVDPSVAPENRMEAVDAFIAEHSDIVICSCADAERERQQHLSGKYPPITGCCLREKKTDFYSREETGDEQEQESR